MYRKLAGLLLSGSIVSILFNPFVGVMIFGSFIVLVVGVGIYRLYENRTRPIPKILMNPPQAPQLTQTEQELAVIMRRYHERATNNGFQSTDNIPESLKI